ncbi:MAG: hypothetical protein HQM04_15025 [Magnetococcales bacterium]|nr:hypothetical protein [Magnetococcales bacterium]
MDRSIQQEVFIAMCSNVKNIEKAWKQQNQVINRNLRKNDHNSAVLNTKMLALIFCAWSEAMFQKLIHTPHGFDISEITQIKNIKNKKSITNGWKKIIELGLNKTDFSKNSGGKANIKQYLYKTIDDYVHEPSLLRNRIIHGQWLVALNSGNDAVNDKITDEISNLDVVVITVWYNVWKTVAGIIESLIESPKRSFNRDYWSEYAKLDDYLRKVKQFSLDKKISLLKKKPIITID